MKQGFSIFVDEQSISTQFFFPEESYDSFVSKTENLEILIEGVILNKKELLKKNATSDFQSLVQKLFETKNWQVIKDLEGEFRGYIWDKTEQEIIVFTNPTATQRVFYTKIENQIFIDASLVRLSKTIKEKQHNIQPNLDSIYQILTFGNMLENYTPINNVFKILDSHFIKINLKNSQITEHCYFDLSKTDYINKNKTSALQDLHDIFSKSILLEYEKDEELQSPHFSLLSGGLDSRMTILYANKFGKKGDVFCFSQKDYWDEKISNQIAQDYGFPYHFVALDGGSFLSKIDQLTEIAEGCGLYTGGIHVQYAFENLAHRNFKLVHSGQIGDGILGGFNTAPRRQKASSFKIVVNDMFLPKTKNTLQKAIDNQISEELFYLRNVAYNRTVLGAQVIQQYAYQTSPFMTKDLIEFAISLPEVWKIKQNFYIEWLNKFLPEAANYNWETTLMKPNAKWKTYWGPRTFVKADKIYKSKILKQPLKTSMYPYQIYHDQSETLQQYYKQYFEENIHRLEQYPELKKDITNLFYSEKFYYKSHAVNILAVFKLYF